MRDRKAVSRVSAEAVPFALKAKDPRHFEPLFEKTTDRISIRVVEYRARATSFTTAEKVHLQNSKIKAATPLKQTAEDSKVVFLKSQTPFPFRLSSFSERPSQQRQFESSKVSALLEGAKSRFFVHRVVGLKHKGPQIRAGQVASQRVPEMDVQLTRKSNPFVRAQRPESQNGVLTEQQIRGAYRCPMKQGVDKLQQHDSYVGLLNNFQAQLEHLEESFDKLQRKKQSYAEQVQLTRVQLQAASVRLHQAVDSIPVQISFRQKTEEIASLIGQSSKCHSENKIISEEAFPLIKQNDRQFYGQIDELHERTIGLQQAVYGDALLELDCQDEQLRAGGIDAVASSEQRYFLINNLF